MAVDGGMGFGRSVDRVVYSQRMICPRCPSSLHALDTAEGETVDYCGECGGTWYDEGELEAVLGLSRLVRLRRVAVAPTPGPRCPRCPSMMNEVSYPKRDPVRIDICRECFGTWLDKAELMQLRAAQTRRFRVAPASDVDDLVVPIKASHRRFDAWALLASLFILAFFGVSTLGLLSVFGAFEHLKDDGLVRVDELVIVAGALVGLPFGGLVMGRLSPGFTIWEPAVASVPILVFYAWLFEAALNPPMIGVLVGLGIILTLAGAGLGERLQSG